VSEDTDQNTLTITGTDKCVYSPSVTNNTAPRLCIAHSLPRSYQHSNLGDTPSGTPALPRRSRTGTSWAGVVLMNFPDQVTQARQWPRARLSQKGSTARCVVTGGSRRPGPTPRVTGLSLTPGTKNSRKRPGQRCVCLTLYPGPEARIRRACRGLSR